MTGTRKADLRTAAGVFAALIGVGVAAGVLWWWVAPQPAYRVATDGLYLVESQPQQYVAADGWFLIITGIVGAAAGLVVWLRCRRTSLGALVGLFVGGLAGAGTAAAVGMLLGRSDPFAAPIGTITQGALEIRAWGVVLVEAMVAVAVWLLLDLLVLRDDEEPAPVLAETAAADDRPDYGALRDL